MEAEELKLRTKIFALRVMKLDAALPSSAIASRAVGAQLARAAPSVGANSRAACRSRAEFVARIAVVEEEADESAYWMEPTMETQLLPPERVRLLHSEARELVAIMAASGRTARLGAKSARSVLHDRDNHRSEISNPKSNERRP